MKYKNLLNDIYINFKSTNKYKPNEYIKFFKENNTNIVNFEINDPKLKKILGIIVEQNHLIFIYFKVKDRENNYLFFSKTHIMEERAIIYNCLLNNGTLESEETIGRNFKKRIDIYKFDFSDIVIQENLLDEEFEEIIRDIINSDSKKYTKRA